MALPKAQQVVEVVEQAAGVLLGVLLLAQGVQVEGQLGPPPGQHQDDEAGVETAHVLLEVEVGRGDGAAREGKERRRRGEGERVQFQFSFMYFAFTKKYTVTFFPITFVKKQF